MWAERVASIDELTVARRLSAEPGFVWLDSNRSESRDGRYSFIAAWPSEEIRVEFGVESPFAALRGVSRRADTVNPEGPRPSEVPAWIGYIAYDAFWSSPARGKPQFEREPDPVLLFRRYPALLAIDHEDGETWVLGDSRSASEAFRERLDTLSERKPMPPSIGAIDVDDAQTHRSAIERALDYIGMGEVYEVNVARQWSGAFAGDALELWLAMRVASRVPLGMFLDGGDHAVLACTMERFIHWDAETKALVTRPIKGTISSTDVQNVHRSRCGIAARDRAASSRVISNHGKPAAVASRWLSLVSQR